MLWNLIYLIITYWVISGAIMVIHFHFNKEDMMASAREYSPILEAMDEQTMAFLMFLTGPFIFPLMIATNLRKLKYWFKRTVVYPLRLWWIKIKFKLPELRKRKCKGCSKHMTRIVTLSGKYAWLCWECLGNTLMTEITQPPTPRS